MFSLFFLGKIQPNLVADHLVDVMRDVFFGLLHELAHLAFNRVPGLCVQWFEQLVGFSSAP